MPRGPAASCGSATEGRSTCAEGFGGRRPPWTSADVGIILVMLPPFDLSVPTDARFRTMAPDVAAKYAELAGCAPVATTAVRDQVDAAATTMATAGENIALGFSTEAAEVIVKMSCGSQTATIRQPR